MRLVRIAYQGKPHWGMVDGDFIQVCEGSPYDGSLTPVGRTPLNGARLLPPACPGKIIAVGVNYADHAKEMGDTIHAEPIIFLKPPSSLIGPQDEIVRPQGCAQLDYEAELALVMGRECKNITPGEADDYILGFTCCNDVTARDIQRRDGQWTRGKGFDTFCPLGPWVETEFDWRGVGVTGRLNGRVVQQGSTADMLTDVAQIVAFVSRVMTLMPGDVITTGTPQGVGPMAEGDIIEIEVEGIGVLKNTVARRGASI